MVTKVLSGLLAFCCGLAFASTESNDFDQTVKQARAAIVKLDIIPARTLLNQACQAEIPAVNPSVRTAICETEMGVIEEAAGNPGPAETHYKNALSIWNRLKPDYAIYRSITMMNLGGLYRTQRGMAEGEAVLTDALALIREHPDSSTLAAIESRLGGLYVDAGALERARPLLNDAIHILHGLTPPNPAELASACSSLGMLNLKNGDHKAAESNLREAVSLATEALGDDHPDTAIYESNLGLDLYLQGKYDQAEVILRRARYVAESRLPGSFELATILTTLTVTETYTGQFAQAVEDGERALTIVSHKRAAESLEMAFAKVALGVAYVHERKTAEAAELLPDAIAVERASAADPRMRDPRVLAYALLALAEVRADERQWSDAQTLYSETISIYERTLGPRDPAIAAVLHEYAEVLKLSGAPRAEVKRVEARAKAIKS
jgi:tetratricopeptide (TPR) repeat protein